MGHEIARQENIGHETGQASFVSIWVGPGAKKKRPTTAECCLSISNQSNQVLGHELSISRYTTVNIIVYRTTNGVTTLA